MNVFVMNMMMNMEMTMSIKKIQELRDEVEQHLYAVGEFQKLVNKLEAENKKLNEMLTDEFIKCLNKAVECAVIHKLKEKNKKLKAMMEKLAEALQKHHDDLNITTEECGDLEHWVVVDGYAESDLGDKTIEALKLYKEMNNETD